MNKNPKAYTITNGVWRPAQNLVLSTASGEITVHTTDPNDLPSVGDQVTKDGETAPDNDYIVSATGYILRVRNGRIKEIHLPQSATDRSRGSANAFAEARAAVAASRKEQDEINARVARNLAARKSNK